MKRCLGCMKQYEEEFNVCPHCGYVEGSVTEEVYHIKPGSILQGRYIVGRVLGYGGFGVTYIGWDPKMERVIAIKEYLPTEFSTRMPEQTRLTIFSGEKEEQFTEGLKKFIDEAKRLAKIQSQLNFSNGVVHIYDSFEENGTAYIIMEHLEGETIADRIKREGKISPKETVELMLPVLYALDEIHENSKYVREDGVEEQIIHRDIAPDNIFITNDFDAEGHRIVKLIDFGASRYSTTRHSKSLSVLIKPGYSPEEQYRSRGDQGPWTDVYAVGATMYRMITGVVPQDAIERPVKNLVKKPSKMGIKIKKSVETAILNAMNIKIENRTQSIEELVHELGAEEVKRKRELIKKTDVGNWPTWLKATTGSVAAAVAVFALLLATGVVKIGLSGYVVSELEVNQARIPNIINMNEADAEKEVASAKIKRDKDSNDEDKLIMQILDKQYDETIANGKILAQSQMPGSVVDVTTEEGRTLGVIVSAGEEKAYVPDVLNMMQDVAESTILNVDLIPNATEEPGDDAPGSVSAQNPEVGSELNTGSDVALTISTGRGFDSSKSSEVPNLVGEQYSDAKAQLLDLGLYLAKSENRVDATIPRGQIIEQDTEPGTSVSQDSTVLVVVSIGTPEVTVPDAQYKDSTTAKTLLEAVGLKVKIVNEDSLVVQKDHVISQSVEAGSKVKAGTEVTLYISKGNALAKADLSTYDVAITQDVMDSQGKTPKPALNILGARVTVPNVTGGNASNAESSIRSAGLVPVLVYTFSNNVPEGSVISQSVSGGSEAEKNTAVTIMVSKGRSAPSGWTTDASFVSNPHYTVREKTQYSVRTRKKETSLATASPGSDWISNGWTGQWTNPVTTNSPVSASDNRQVTKNMVSAESNNRVFFHYKCNTRLDYLPYNPGGYDSYREMRDSDLGNDGASFREHHRDAATGQTIYVIAGPDGTIWGAYEKSEAWFLKRVETVPAVYNYTYKDKIFAWYRYSGWSGWSEWQDSSVSSNDTVEVNTRKVYLYTAK